MASRRNKLGGGTQSKCSLQERRNHRRPERDESASLQHAVVYSRRELAHLNRNCDDDFTPTLPSTSTPTLPLLPSTFRLLMKLINSGAAESIGLLSVLRLRASQTSRSEEKQLGGHYMKTVRAGRPAGAFGGRPKNGVASSEQGQCNPHAGQPSISRPLRPVRRLERTAPSRPPYGPKVPNTEVGKETKRRGTGQENIGRRPQGNGIDPKTDQQSKPVEGRPTSDLSSGEGGLSSHRASSPPPSHS